MNVRRLLSPLVLVFLLVAAASPRASGPTFWTVATATEFLRGTSEGVYVSLSGVLTAEMARNQELNTNLMVAQGIAQDSMKLSQEITALYLSSFKDQSLITRILSLPLTPQMSRFPQNGARQIKEFR